MTAQEFLAAQTREMTDWMQQTIGKMPEDKLSWKPLDNGRDVHDQIIECARVNLVMAQAIRDRTAPVFDKSVGEKFWADNDTMGKAMMSLKTSTELLASAIESFPSDRLDEEVPLPFGQITSKPFSWVLGMPYWNMSYHLGQINYIQTLYGDNG